MKRPILGIVAAFAVWTVLWLGGNAVFFAEAAEVVGRGDRYAETGPLLATVGWSVVCSLAAGAVVAGIARRTRRPAVLITGVLLLLVGIGVQASYWSQLPTWYHVAFLALLIPVTIVGGRLVPGGGRGSSATRAAAADAP